MARYRKLEVLTTIKETGIVPVFYSDLDTAKAVATACWKGKKSSAAT